MSDPIRVVMQALSPPEARADSEEEARNVLSALHDAGWRIVKFDPTFTDHLGDDDVQCITAEWLPGGAEEQT